MKHLLLGLGLLCMVTRAAAQAPTWQGGAQTTNPTPTDSTEAVAASIAADAAGSLFVGGSMLENSRRPRAATRVLGPATLGTQGSGPGIGFVARLSAQQQWQWTVPVTNSAVAVRIESVAATPAGEVFAAGGRANFIGSLTGTTLRVGSLTQTVTAENTFFITRLGSSGQPQWIVQGALTGPGSNGQAWVQSLRWDAATNSLVVVGTYGGGALVLGSFTLPHTPFPVGGTFVARLSAAGQWQSATGVTLSNPGSNREFAVIGSAVGPQGQVAVTGALTDATVSFGATTLTATGAGQRLFVAQLSAAGSWTWAATSTGPGDTAGYGVSYTRGGALWLSGSAYTGAVLGSVPVSGAPFARQGFVGQLSATGQWGPVAAVASVYFDAVVGDGAGNAVVLGGLDPPYTPTPMPHSYAFGPHSFTATGRRSLVARLSPAGQWQYALPTPVIGTGADPGNDYRMYAAALDATGTLFTAGSFFGGPLALGGTTLTGTAYVNNLSSYGGDALVARLPSAGAPLAVRAGSAAGLLSCYPNPVATGQSATLQLAAPAPRAQSVALRDALGRVVARAIVSAGQQHAAVPTLGLSPGLYLLEAGLSRAQVVIE